MWSLLTIGQPTVAAPPVFLPAWTWHLPGEPDRVRACPGEQLGTERIAVTISPNRVQLITADGRSLLADFWTPEPIVDLQPLPGEALLAVASAHVIRAFDARGGQHWQVHLPEAGTITRLATADLNGSGRQELVALTGHELVVINEAGQVTRRFPHQLPVADRPQGLQFEAVALDQEPGAELVLCDGHWLAVFSATGEQLLRLPLHVRPLPDSLSAPAGPFIVRSLGHNLNPEILTVLAGRGGPALIALNDVRGLPLWERPLPRAESILEIPLIAVLARNIYTAARLVNGDWLLRRHDSIGLVTDEYRFRSTDGIRRLLSLVACGQFLLVAISRSTGLDCVTAFTPGLEPVEIHGLGYHGIQLRELRTCHLDNDDRPDILILRRSPEGRSALDAFRNNTRAVEEELARTRQQLRRALLWNQPRAAARCRRRLELMSGRLGRTEALRTELAFFKRQSQRAGWLRAVRLSASVALGLLIVFLALLLLWRHRRQGFASRRLAWAELVAICHELISLDHVYVAKGHVAGGQRRLVQLRERHGLRRDPDLALIDRSLEPHYHRYIRRLLDEHEAQPLGALLDEISRAQAPRHGPMVSVTLTPEQFRQQVPRGLDPGHWLVRIRNWEAPDIFERCRILFDRQL
ncbi:MAG: hypothetical protein ABIK62_03790, partial [candidate division WOR-3 bacterium]